MLPPDYAVRPRFVSKPVCYPRYLLAVCCQVVVHHSTIHSYSPILHCIAELYLCSVVSCLLSYCNTPVPCCTTFLFRRPGIRDDPNFDVFVKSLETAPSAGLGKDAEYALWINSYNALAIHTVTQNACKKRFLGLKKSKIASIKGWSVAKSVVLLYQQSWGLWFHVRETTQSKYEPNFNNVKTTNFRAGNDRIIPLRVSRGRPLLFDNRITVLSCSVHLQQTTATSKRGGLGRRARVDCVRIASLRY